MCHSGFLQSEQISAKVTLAKLQLTVSGTHDLEYRHDPARSLRWLCVRRKSHNVVAAGVWRVIKNYANMGSHFLVDGVAVPPVVKARSRATALPNQQHIDKTR